MMSQVLKLMPPLGLVIVGILLILFVLSLSEKSAYRFFSVVIVAILLIAGKNMYQDINTAAKHATAVFESYANYPEQINTLIEDFYKYNNQINNTLN